MIKRLIFDVDNTLILWKKEYDKALDKTLDELQYPKTENLYNEINNAEIEYEKNTKKFDKIEMTNYINKKLNLQLPNNFIEIWLKNLAYCIPEKLKEEYYKKYGVYPDFTICTIMELVNNKSNLSNKRYKLFIDNAEVVFNDVFKVLGLSGFDTAVMTAPTVKDFKNMD